MKAFAKLLELLISAAQKEGFFVKRDVDGIILIGRGDPNNYSVFTAKEIGEMGLSKALTVPKRVSDQAKERLEEKETESSKALKNQ